MDPSPGLDGRMSLNSQLVVKYKMSPLSVPTINPSFNTAKDVKVKSFSLISFLAKGESLNCSF